MDPRTRGLSFTLAGADTHLPSSKPPSATANDAWTRSVPGATTAAMRSVRPAPGGASQAHEHLVDAPDQMGLVHRLREPAPQPW